MELNDIPKHFKRAGKKRFGVEHFSRWFGEWYTHSWYATEQARNHGMECLRKKFQVGQRILRLHFPGTFENYYRKVDR